MLIQVKTHQLDNIRNFYGCGLVCAKQVLSHFTKDAEDGASSVVPVQVREELLEILEGATYAINNNSDGFVMFDSYERKQLRGCIELVIQSIAVASLAKKHNCPHSEVRLEGENVYAILSVLHHYLISSPEEESENYFETYLPFLADCEDRYHLIDALTKVLRGDL